MPKEKKLQPLQTQKAPGIESEMKPKPKAEDEGYRGSKNLYFYPHLFNDLFN